MKRILVIALFLWAAEAEGAITKIAQVACPASGGGSCTTSAVNGAGGNFVSIVVSDGSGGTTTLSDSSGNSYTQCGPTETEAGDGTRVRVFYVANATVSSSMTFTATGTSSFPSIIATVFAGVKPSSPCDQSNGANSPSALTTAQFGSVTPTANGSLIISAIGQAIATTGQTISSPFTFTNTTGTDFEPANSGVSYGSGTGYQIQTTATAENPTWSWTTGSPFAGVNATFLPAATGLDTSMDCGNNGGTTSTLSCTYVTGVGSTLMFMGVLGDLIPGTDDVQPCTYNGVTSTLVAKHTDGTQANRFMYLYALANPAIGSHTLTCTASSSHYILMGAITYTGTVASATMDATLVGGTSSTSFTETGTITTVTNNDWVVMLAWPVSQNTCATAGAGATFRVCEGVFHSWVFFDSNAAVTPAGNYSMTYNWTTVSATSAHIMAAFRPIQPVSTNHGLMLGGVH